MELKIKQKTKTKPINKKTRSSIVKLSLIVLRVVIG